MSSRVNPIEQMYRLPGRVTNAIWLATVLAVASLYPVLNSPRGTLHHVNVGLDDHIPLIPWFVIVYVSWYVLLFILVMTLIRRGPKTLGKVSLAIIITYLLSYLVFLSFQTEIVRPQVTGTDWPSGILTDLYALDNPYNGLPSLHTSLSVLTIITWWRLKLKFASLVTVWALTVIASTVLVKQHYFLDIPAGVAAAIISYYAALRLHPRLPQPKGV